MDILFVTQQYHPFIGGVETQTRLVVKELARRHNVAVVAANFEMQQVPGRLRVLCDSLLTPAYESHRDGEVQVHALTPSLPDRVRMLPVAVRAVPLLRRFYYHQLRRFGYRAYRSVYLPRLIEIMQGHDVVHSVAGGYLGWAAQEAALHLGIPFALTPYVHPGQAGGDPDSVRYYERSDAVFALHEGDHALLRSLGVAEDKLHISGVVPLLPDTADPEGFRRAHGLEGKPVVLYVGRIEAYKGVPAILAAAPNVWKAQPEVHFVFIGPAGSEEQSWFEHTDPRIRYLGRVSEQEKADALAACDLFCMPSQFEILPAVYLEAWSYGKAVIGGKAQGLPAFIEGNEAGVTVEQDPGEIASHITGLLRDPVSRERMGQNGRALVRRRYTVDALVGGMEATYEGLLPGRPEAQRRSPVYAE